MSGAASTATDSDYALSHANSASVDAEKTYKDNAIVTILVIGTIYTAAFLDRQSMALLVDPIKTHLQISDFQISLLLGAAFSLFYAAMNVPAGTLIDRVDRRKLILITGTCWSVASIACGLSTAYWQLFLARMALGGAEAFIAPAAFALMRDRVPPEMQGRSYSVLGMAPYLGGTLALILGGALLRAAMAGSFAGVPFINQLEAWQIVLITLGAFAFLPVLLLFLISPDSEQRKVASKTGVGLAGALRHIRAHKGAYAIVVGYATVSSMLTFGKGAWTPTMMSRTYGIPLPEIGMISGPISLVSALTGLAFCGFIMDRIAKRNGSLVPFASFCAVLAAAGAVLTSLAPAAWLAWTGYGLSSFFAGAFYPVGARTLASITPSPMMGKVSALYLLCQNLIGSAVGPMIIAYMSDNWFEGRYALGNSLALYCTCVGAAAFYFATQLGRCKAHEAA